MSQTPEEAKLLPDKVAGALAFFASCIRSAHALTSPILMLADNASLPPQQGPDAKEKL